MDSILRFKHDIALRRCRQALIWTICLECFSWPFWYYEFIIYSQLPSVFYEWGPLFFFVVTIFTELYSLYLPIRYFRVTKIRSLYPLLVVVIAHFVISHTDPSGINIRSYDLLFRKEREYVVSSYCSGKLLLENGDCNKCVELPEKLTHLSLMSDHVDIECDGQKYQALFYTRWGFFSYWEALLYRIDGSYTVDPYILKSYKITRLSDHWFYIVH